VAVVEEVTEVAAVVAAEVVVEVLTAEDLPLTRDIKFSATNEKARLDLTTVLSRFELHVFKILPNSKFNTRTCLALFLRSDSVLIPPPCFDRKPSSEPCTQLFPLPSVR
jgi:xanthine dehydrogenase molybdopterin-binding subunit B